VASPANIVFGGKTPDPGQPELARMGFAMVLYANAVLQAAVKGAINVLDARLGGHPSRPCSQARSELE
jgi:2-methylisocitrate lyase-like PEP mutase family enzyme